MKSTKRDAQFKRAAAPKPKFARGTRASFQSCIDPNINGTGLVVEAKYFPKDGRFLYTVEREVAGSVQRYTFFEEEMAKPSDPNFKDRRQIALDLCEHIYDDHTRDLEI